MSEYREIIIQTHLNKGGGSKNKIRARPFAGQGLDTSINVRCSPTERKEKPIGSLFLLEVRMTDRVEEFWTRTDRLGEWAIRRGWASRGHPPATNFRLTSRVEDTHRPRTSA